eukprot:jgi/Chlat1/771/Chrsp104S00029
MHSLAQGPSYVDFSDVAAGVAAGTNHIVAVLAKAHAARETVMLRASLISHAFEKAYGTKLSTQAVQDRGDHEQRSARYTVRDELTTTGEPSAPITSPEYRDFQQTYLSQVLATPSYEDTWLGPLMAVPGVVRALVVNFGCKTRPRIILQSQVKAQATCSCGKSYCTSGQGAVPGLPSAMVAGPNCAPVWDVVLSHCASLINLHAPTSEPAAVVLPGAMPDTVLRLQPQPPPDRRSTPVVVVHIARTAPAVGVAIRLVHMGDELGCIIVFQQLCWSAVMKPMGASSRVSRDHMHQVAEHKSPSNQPTPFISAKPDGYCTSWDDSSIHPALLAAMKASADNMEASFNPNLRKLRSIPVVCCDNDRSASHQQPTNHERNGSGIDADHLFSLDRASLDELEKYLQPMQAEALNDSIPTTAVPRPVRLTLDLSTLPGAAKDTSFTMTTNGHTADASVAVSLSRDPPINGKLADGTVRDLAVERTPAISSAAATARDVGVDVP